MKNIIQITDFYFLVWLYVASNITDKKIKTFSFIHSFSRNTCLFIITM